jgi:hypothetical protein
MTARVAPPARSRNSEWEARARLVAERVKARPQSTRAKVAPPVVPQAAVVAAAARALTVGAAEAAATWEAVGVAVAEAADCGVSCSISRRTSAGGSVTVW